MTQMELKSFLDDKANQYNNVDFIATDPIQIPHHFTQKLDIEISALLIATIAWGNRKSIIKNGMKLIQTMDMAPHDFVMNATTKDIKQFVDFKHRTFNAFDLEFFLYQIKRLLKEKGSLEDYFIIKEHEVNPMQAIDRFRLAFLNNEIVRTSKHVSSPKKNSAAKRLNMFLRWMVRDDNAGVDFGIWKRLPHSKLSIPLDVHSGRVARDLGLLNRKQNDRKAVEELDTALRQFNPKDPVKYDFALFGIGAFESF